MALELEGEGMLHQLERLCKSKSCIGRFDAGHPLQRLVSP